MRMKKGRLRNHQAVIRVFEHGQHLFARDAGKPYQKIIHGRTSFEVLEQSMNRHASPIEKPRATDTFGSSFSLTMTATRRPWT